MKTYAPILMSVPIVLFMTCSLLSETISKLTPAATETATPMNTTAAEPIPIVPTPTSPPPTEVPSIPTESAPTLTPQTDIVSTDTSIWTGIRPWVSIRSLAIDPATPTTLYAGTDIGLLKSTNGGQNWNAVNTGLTNSSVSTLAIDPMTPATVYAGGVGCSKVQTAARTGMRSTPA